MPFPALAINLPSETPMKTLTLVLVTVSLFLVSPVTAEEEIEPISTEYLYGTCRAIGYENNTLYARTYCRAFFQGFVNANKHLTSSYNFPSQYCLPASNVEKKIAEIFIKFVQENPQFLKKTAIYTLYYALHGAFPCTEPESSK